MWNEFKEFLSRGNVLELAVAVVIGLAFNEIVNSLVEHILTPIIGIFMGGLDFIETMSFTVGGATIQYGIFLMRILDFVIIAFALFLIVKVYNRFRRKEDKKDEVKKEVEPSQEVVLLTQIRDALTRGGDVARQAPPQPPRGTD